jgi:hypothetical protein
VAPKQCLIHWFNLKIYQFKLRVQFYPPDFYSLISNKTFFPCGVNASVAEPHHFYAAPAPGKNFDAAPAAAPTLLYSKAKFLK